ncbi:Fc.00g112320.m01.CDS01 [Cosmosporella sp. VM-42]
MRLTQCLPIRLRSSARIPLRHSPRRSLVTLAIETSCDDTGVAILDHTPRSTKLLYNERISSDNRAFKGIHPLVAVKGHAEALAPLVKRALSFLPDAKEDDGGRRVVQVDGVRKQLPDFVSVTRGPGMRSNLGIGLDMAKGLAVAWGVPLVGVHHMQAHALTPRLARALGMSMGETPAAVSKSASASTTNTNEDPKTKGPNNTGPNFPFLSLLVSGGHTQLVHSTSLTAHSILATTGDIAIGNLLDQTARDILPADVFDASDHVMYGRLLEAFAFPDPSTEAYDAVFTPARSRGEEMKDVDTGYDWTVPLPFRQSRKLAFSFSSIYTHVHNLATARIDIPLPERRALAQQTMAAAFRHLAGRLVLALEDLPDLRSSRTLVVAGGVASNKFLMHVLRRTLEARGFAVDKEGGLEIVAPPVELCTDNAAMIAWTGMEMFEAGWESELGITGIGRWPMDGEGGGILGVDGWVKREN